MMKALSMIACVSKDGGLGKYGKLLWNIPEDMKFFRETTRGSLVVMGRKTFESIGHALPSRRNVVLSSQKGDDASVEWATESEARAILHAASGPKFIIGGASLYAMFLPEAEKIFLTEVDDTKPADAYFPEFDRDAWQRRIIQTGEYDGTKYEMVEYIRKEVQHG